ncbi:MAG: hypothetical protein KC561_15170, partial [Myxococcales bacterium]|nr:hypothetical protein [Myxococcales bacterium]
MTSTPTEDWLPETSLAIEQVERLVAASRAPQAVELDPQILAYLVRHIVILLCSEIQREVTKHLINRVGLAGDAHVVSLVRGTSGSIVRSARPDDISDVMAKLSPELKSYFKRRLKEELDEQASTLLGNVVTQRNSIAHDTQPNVTFSEMR